MFDYFCPVWDGLNNGLRDKLTGYGLRNIENKLAMPNSCTAAMRHNCGKAFHLTSKPLDLLFNLRNKINRQLSSSYSHTETCKSVFLKKISILSLVFLPCLNKVFVYVDSLHTLRC